MVCDFQREERSGVCGLLRYRLGEFGCKPMRNYVEDIERYQRVSYGRKPK
jgi:hypothetical protein